MTTGSIVGGIVGAGVGFLLGGPAGAFYYGAVGFAAGGLLDPPKLPSVQGPRLSDLSLQTSAYGQPLARVYGTVPIVGNIFWLENNRLRETVKKKKQGGKGGPSQTTKTYTYSGTFAIALADTRHTGAIQGVRRIWCGALLIYNAGSDDLGTIIQSNASAAGWRLYTGTADQLPDPRMQATVGVDECPAYRYTAYVVFYDFALEKFGNSLQAAQFKFEVVRELAAGPVILNSQQVPWNVNNATAFAHFMTSSSTVVNIPQWVPTDSDPSEYLREKVLTTTMRSLAPIAVPVAGFAQPSGVTDTDILPNLTGSPIATYFTGRFVIKNGIWYAWLWDGRFYRRNPLTLAWVEFLFDDVQSLTVDDLGYMYATNHTGVYKYDEDFNLVAFSDQTFGSNLYNQNLYTAHDSPYVYFALENAADTPIYRMTDDLLEYTALGAAPTGVSVGDVSQFNMNVDNGIMTRVISDGANGIVYVDRINVRHVDPELVPLSEIVSDELQLSRLIELGDIDTSDLVDEVRGYRVTGGSIKNSLAPLQGAYPFDIIPSGYQIKCVARGKSAVRTVPLGDLGAVAGLDMAELVIDGPTREMDTQLPKTVVIDCMDADRDYDTNEQIASRVATDAVDIETNELPLVLTPDECAGMAQRLLYLRWLERDDYAGNLPPIYNDLEAADVINIVADYGTFPLRFTEINYGSDSVLGAKWKPNAPGIYTPNAQGGQGATPNGSIPFNGDSILLLLDIPMMRPTDNTPGFVGVMAGEQASWQGGVAFRSNDGGQTFDDIQAFDAPGTFGTATNALGQDDGYVIDYDSTLSCAWIAGTPESVTVDQLLMGLNYFVYGAPGRWEILQAASATLEVDGTYTFATFLRGQRGTEWTTGLHVAGDYFILLDDPDNIFIGSGFDSFGIERLWRAVSQGQTIDSVPNQAFTYNGVNLKPLSPVDPVGTRDGSFNLTVTFNRRSRFQDSFWVTGVQPIVGEDAEAYEIDILNGATVVRTIAVGAPTFGYSAAEQTADFGVHQPAIAMRIYQLSAAVGRGYPLEVTL